MRGAGGPAGADPIPTREWAKGLLFVAAVIVIVAVLFFLTNGPKAT